MNGFQYSPVIQNGLRGQMNVGLAFWFCLRTWQQAVHSCWLYFLVCRWNDAGKGLTRSSCGLREKHWIPFMVKPQYIVLRIKVTINVNDFRRLRRDPLGSFQTMLLLGQRGGPVCGLFVESHGAAVIWVFGFPLHTRHKQQRFQDAALGQVLEVCRPCSLCVSFPHLWRKEKFVSDYSLSFCSTHVHPGFPSALAQRNLENLRDSFPELEISTGGILFREEATLFLSPETLLDLAYQPVRLLGIRQAPRTKC